MEDKKSFVLYHDYAEPFNVLSDNEAGKLIKAIFDYESSGILTEFEGALKIAFIIIKNKLDKDRKKTRFGEYHWNWKGGISSENHSVRNSSNYKNWRKEVFSRDNYTCQKCGKIGGKLNAHHIELFSKNKEKCFELSNGITLCSNCHKKEHVNYHE